jgi:NAD(P)-dependent dehydrogenase (short-subunit alcohol dehydrogenase family)
MKKTIVITGASSGIGKATAKYFHDKGWNVVATMRKPADEKDLKESSSLKLVALDVEKPESIKNAMAESIKAFNKIDVWLNNAGYGAFGPLETGTREQIQRQFDVNFFGLIECIKAITPHLRENKSGTIINVTSIGGLMTIPTFSVYNASKFALEGLSEGLWYELQPFGIRVKVVEPGGVKTDFSGRSMDQWDTSGFPQYKPLMDVMHSRFTNPDYTKNFSEPELVAGVIYEAATDGKNTLRYLAGKDAKLFWGMRRWMGYQFQMKQLKKYFGI